MLSDLYAWADHCAGTDPGMISNHNRFAEGLRLFLSQSRFGVVSVRAEGDSRAHKHMFTNENFRAIQDDAAGVQKAAEPKFKVAGLPRVEWTGNSRLRVHARERAPENAVTMAP